MTWIEAAGFGVLGIVLLIDSAWTRTKVARLDMRLDAIKHQCAMLGVEKASREELAEAVLAAETTTDESGAR